MKLQLLTVPALILALAAPPSARAEPPPIVQQEINYLLLYIRDSGCDFKRNGSWNHDSRAAEAHVRGKYDFLARMDMIDTTRDFIDRAATRSSLTGEPYEIRCGANLPVPSSLWLSNELARYQASHTP